MSPLFKWTAAGSIALILAPQFSYARTVDSGKVWSVIAQDLQREPLDSKVVEGGLKFSMNSLKEARVGKKKPIFRLHPMGIGRGLCLWRVTT